MTKQQAREFFLKRRSSISPADSELVAAQLVEIFSRKPVSLLHAFIGSRARNEIDTKLIRQILLAKSPTLQWAAPRMIPGTWELENYFWNDETELIANRWGIEEPNPDTSQPVDINTIDAVLVPLLAFDKKGHRVGYGGGYYDRFLAQCKADTLKIGLSSFEPIEEIEDVNEWDVKLDYCVTSGNIYHWHS